MMMKITNHVVFTDEDSPESGYLLWNYLEEFIIYDPSMIEVDRFPDYNCSNDIIKAREVATNHFSKVGESL